MENKPRFDSLMRPCNVGPQIVAIFQYPAKRIGGTIPA